MRVRTSPPATLPERLEPSAWDTLARLRDAGELWDFFEPSPSVPVSSTVRRFAEAHGVVRAADPLTCVRGIVSAVYRALVYAPDSTTVDTPIETVLETRFLHQTFRLVEVIGIERLVAGMERRCR